MEFISGVTALFKKKIILNSYALNKSFNLCIFSGDDEQSDYFGDPRRDEDNDLDLEDNVFNSIFSRSLEQISTDARLVVKKN